MNRPNFVVSEKMIEVCNGYECCMDRRFMALRSVKVFGLHVFYWPVVNGKWRSSIGIARNDICEHRRITAKSTIHKAEGE